MGDTTSNEGSSIQEFTELFGAVEAEIAQVVHGQQEAIRGLLIALFGGGHVLLEGAPGLGKTLLARTIARVLGCRFRRIQFTPDLMPADVTGGNIFNQKESRFEFVAGPVFTEVLLADEINRSPARTQAALLEAMADRQVTVDGISRALNRPFFTVATQNPVESEGTWALPEAQLDRFLMKILLFAPSREVEIGILESHLQGFDVTELEQVQIKQMLTAEELVQWQKRLRKIRASKPILSYTCDIVSRTREHRSIYLGASPRASISLLLSAQVLAAAEGRDFVVPDDIKELAPSVLRHRLILQPEAELEGGTVEDIIRELLHQTPIPAGADRK